MFPHPPTPDNTLEVLPMTTLPYVLRRVHPDGTTEPVSEHPDFGEGWAAGQSAVHRDREHAYRLVARGQTVARFAHARARSRQGDAILDALVIS